MMTDRTNSYLKLMMASIILLMIANFGLFIRMNQLQGEVLSILGSLQPPKGLDVGVEAPQFSLKDLKNQTISLNSFKGQKVLLVFSSTTCSACQKFWPILQQFHLAHPGLSMVLILRGSAEETEEVKKEEGFSFPILGWEDEIAQLYKVSGTPYIVLVSGDQKISFTGFSSDLARLESVVAE